MSIRSELARAYRRDPQTGVWERAAAEAGTAFDYSDGDEAEERLGRIIDEAHDTTVYSPELAAQITDWPSRYHLSSRRSHLLRPFLAGMRGPVLEVGAGTGVLTRVLGEAGIEVVAVEGSPRRARIAARRCADLPTVHVVAESIQNLSGAWDGAFGSVLLIGVLEYARVHFSGAGDGDPVERLLDRARDHLTADGVLHLAIENQLGLKYLAGYPEDHLGVRMAGVEDRYDENGIVTFGRAQLAERLRRAGLTEQDWWLPFPDYKLPVTLISQRAAAQPGLDLDLGSLAAASVLFDPQRPVDTTFDLQQAWPAVSRNGLLPELANSFFVRASRSPMAADDALVWHFGSDRIARFAKSVVFRSDEGGAITVHRSPLEVSAETDGRPGPAIEFADERFTPGRNWRDALTRVVSSPGWSHDDITAWARTWWDAVASEAGGRLTADAVLAPRLLDAVPRNLLVSPGSAKFIDLEWSAGEDLTAGRLMFRGLWDSLLSIERFSTPAPGTETRLGELIGLVSAALGLAISRSDRERYADAESAFQAAVAGVPVDAEFRTRLEQPVAIRPGIGELIDLAHTDDDVRERARELAISLEQFREQGMVAQRRAAELQHEVSRRGARMRHLELDAEAARRELERHLAAAADKDKGNQETARRLAVLEDERRSHDDEFRSALERARAAADEAATQRLTVSWRITSPLRRVRRTRAGETLWRVLRWGYRLRLHRAQAVAPTAVPAPVNRTDRVAPAIAEPELDLAYYRARYPDLQRLSKERLRQHYRVHGRLEGRRAQPVAAGMTLPALPEDERPVVLLLVHEATRTGAPILAWNIARQLRDSARVVVVLKKGGPLEDHFTDAGAAVVGPPHDDLDGFETEALVERLVTEYAPLYAIANSSETRAFVLPLERRRVPTVLLVHEFAESVTPRGDLDAALVAASEIVVPAPVVATSLRRGYGVMDLRTFRVQPQGRSEVPRRTRRTPPEAHRLPEDGDFVVIGAGTVHWRKGVEFFIQAAAASSRASGRPVRFIWIGGVGAFDREYFDRMITQVQFSGLETTVSFVDEVEDLGPYYDRADAFLLSSRFDPMPNVAIEAAVRGIPVICFEGASGMADILGGDARVAPLVVPYLDAGAASEVILRLANDAAWDEGVRAGIADLAGTVFDMPAYATELHRLGVAAAAVRERLIDDRRLLAASDVFNAPLFWGSRPGRVDTERALDDYLLMSRLAAPRRRPRAGLIMRRGAEGFHPLIYASEAPGYDESDGSDPLADWVRRGRPAGRWTHPVIGPLEKPAETTAVTSILHGHFYYPETLDGLLDRLSLNRHRPRLLLTTDTDQKADQLRAIASAHGAGDAEVVVSPNVGRNIGPLLTALGPDAFAEADLILHVHSKKSLHTEEATGTSWRDFLWGSLVGVEVEGRPVAAMDAIVAAFASDPDLGLVFPEDPHLNDWDENLHLARELASRLGIPRLPTHFDFPMGTMFWARPAALAPIFDLGMSWEDYPAEPTPIDGTVLHALERLLPFAAERAGFGYATVHIPGVSR
ncbi:MAG TPA: rhamnan synthesis F family protein [Pseudolysinimonas sp.]|nr:rhamnan synthesis F family protein [Pseudolysinimonas sp.]